jgi:hypothetical protein
MNSPARPDLEGLKVLLDKATPAWCDAMVAAFGMRARRAQRPQDVREGMRDRATAEQLATAMPEIASLIAHIERLEGLVEEAAGWFEQYAVEHYAKAKTAPDTGEQHGREVKGKTNCDRATYLRATLTQGTSHE